MCLEDVSLLLVHCILQHKKQKQVRNVLHTCCMLLVKHSGTDRVLEKLHWLDSDGLLFRAFNASFSDVPSLNNLLLGHTCFSNSSELIFPHFNFILSCSFLLI